MSGVHNGDEKKETLLVDLVNVERQELVNVRFVHNKEDRPLWNHVIRVLDKQFTQWLRRIHFDPLTQLSALREIIGLGKHRQLIQAPIQHQGLCVPWEWRLAWREQLLQPLV